MAERRSRTLREVERLAEQILDILDRLQLLLVVAHHAERCCSIPHEVVSAKGFMNCIDSVRDVRTVNLLQEEELEWS